MKPENIQTNERPTRMLEKLGPIPDSLPSVYDFVEGGYGAPDLVKGPLMAHFMDEEYQMKAFDKDTNIIKPEDVVDTFIKEYYSKPKNYDESWVRNYDHLMNLSCEGWIQRQFIVVPKRLNRLDVDRFTHSLSSHLKEAEKMWGVTWLTSKRSIAGQEDREETALADYLDKYENGGMTSSEFFLNTAGDLLINKIRLTTPTETYTGWQKTADEFVKSGQS